MTIDDDTLKQLLRIDDELMQLCKLLNEKRDMEISSRLNTLSGRPDPHSNRSGQEQTPLEGNDDAALQRILHRRQCAAGSSV